MSFFIHFSFVQINVIIYCWVIYSGTAFGILFSLFEHRYHWIFSTHFSFVNMCKMFQISCLIRFAFCDLKSEWLNSKVKSLWRAILRIVETLSANKLFRSIQNGSRVDIRTGASSSNPTFIIREIFLFVNLLHSRFQNNSLCHFINFFLTNFSSFFFKTFIMSLLSTAKIAKIKNYWNEPISVAFQGQMSLQRYTIRIIFT